MRASLTDDIWRWIFDAEKSIPTLVAICSLVVIYQLDAPKKFRQDPADPKTFLEERSALPATVALGLFVGSASHLLNTLFKGMHKRFVRRKFARFFSLEQGDHSAVIVLPRFLAPEQRTTRNNPRTDSQNQDGAPATNPQPRKNVSLEMKKLAALGDIKCAAQIVTMFEENLQSVPQIIADHPVERETMGRRTLIAVGLFSNCLTTELAKNGSPIGLIMPHDQQHEVGGGFAIRSCKSGDWGTKYRKSDLAEDRDFVLIAKLWNPQTKGYCFVCAGLTEPGTEAAGRYLNENWQDILQGLRQQCQETRQRIVFRGGSSLTGSVR